MTTSRAVVAGGVLGQQGRYPEEHLILEQAMAIDPLNELLAVNYADNQRITGDFKAAREMLRNLIDLRPDSTVLLRSLAQQELAEGEWWRLEIGPARMRSSRTTRRSRHRWPWPG